MTLGTIVCFGAAVFLIGFISGFAAAPKPQPRDNRGRYRRK